MKRYSSALLAVLLLLAQFTLITHQLDINAHKGGELCHICLHATPLDNLAVATIDVIPEVGQQHVEPALEHFVLISLQLPARHARGPPTSFV